MRTLVVRRINFDVRIAWQCEGCNVTVPVLNVEWQHILSRANAVLCITRLLVGLKSRELRRPAAVVCVFVQHHAAAGLLIAGQRLLFMV
jgi:hypothetical protein